MKKVILFLTLSALAMLCYTCVEAFAMRKAVEKGEALPGVMYEIMDITLNDKATYNECVSKCNDECKRRGLSIEEMVVRVGNKSCICEMKSNLSHVVYIDDANTEGDCSVSAWNAGYMWYYYEDGDSRCSGAGRYEYLGAVNKTKECIAMAKEHGFPMVVMHPVDKEKCFGVMYEESGR
jgi:hypothetical protein